ncbi:hypothetical protein BpHYR1_038551 [Brachionus plicatilis]|uniref:Uncharacterized protein n=1 Tax=Brachionus plicatilis TaxID=10195 RepID=A0A3M7R399_BRAPC|nr:hypothetical protein BpHYR1_038551 [Brachionus plicatilis]
MITNLLDETLNAKFTSLYLDFKTIQVYSIRVMNIGKFQESMNIFFRIINFLFTSESHFLCILISLCLFLILTLDILLRILMQAYTNHSINKLTFFRDLAVVYLDVHTLMNVFNLLD